MTPKNDGGPAFPRTWTERYGGEALNNCDSGMSLRDWFAGQLMPYAFKHTFDSAAAARRCYAVADAMLAAREEK